MAFLRGTVDRVEPPNEYGWSKIWVTADGHDKPVRIDTNKEPQLREAMELRDTRAFINLEFDERTKYDQASGRSYLNRYWVRAQRTAGTNGGGTASASMSDAGGLRYGDPAPPPPAPTPSFDKPTPEVGRSTNPRDAWRMSLAKASELAIATLPYLPVEQRTPAVQKEVALFWARFIFETEYEASYSAASTPSTNADPGGPMSPWPTDDDIPFAPNVL